MSDVKFLVLKKILTVWDAARWVARDGGRHADAMAAIVDAIASEELPAQGVRPELHHVPFSIHDLHGVSVMETTVHRTDLEAWLTSKGLSQVTQASGIASAPLELSVTAEKLHPAASTSHRIRNRTRLLDTEINDAKTQASNGRDHHSVWTALRDMALAEKGAFTGIADTKKGLEYTATDGSKKYLSKDALRKRLDPNAR